MTSEELRKALRGNVVVTVTPRILPDEELDESIHSVMVMLKGRIIGRVVLSNEEWLKILEAP